MKTASVLTVYQEDPLNAGTSLAYLTQIFLTPSDWFFIRGHGTIPLVGRDTYRLVVKGMVQHPLELSMEELLTQFPQRQLVATLICAGSRRNELVAIHPLPGEILWGADWISILEDTAGVEEEARYVAFRGRDQAQVAGDLGHFCSSTRLEKVLTPEVLLVHEMNGAPLPREHGFPLRILVPDYVGARSVKWLQDITLQSQPSTNYFQARDYKTFPPTVAAETVDWEQILSTYRENGRVCKKEGRGKAKKQKKRSGYCSTMPQFLLQ
ncbi:hypothetical protein KSC_032480 [Ktedonobacter sp. SOSP1-52]|uniref:molybdopterin-dependent oxidoreductase n=1 Tax=Ktedonobacter sp. SOSP1-52 TaxID=2778366 RepID=UPI00191639BA|nr:molybdopterin-dependent oxidoreductase [Ktedonobacter sp. SOSP1-52]GHO64356.1 hypothetical protein KSC_032480 [Ktedonobacter sp. SOSP1-52]